MSESVGRTIVFGAGPVGIATAKALLRRGEAVTLVNRSGRRPSGMQDDDVRMVSCDLADPAAVRSAAEGAATIFHCANPLYHQWKDLLPAMQRNLVDAAVDNDALLACSENLYMYTGTAEVITEETPTDPPSRKGRIRLNLTRELEEAARTRGLRWTSVRASDYYGPWATYQSMFGTDRFLDALSAGKRPGVIGRMDVKHSYTYIEDFGEALVTAARNPSAHGRAWICPNAPARTTGEVATMFIERFPGDLAAGLRPRRLPDTMLRIAGMFDPVIREIPEMLYQKEQTYIADGTQFAETFGFVPTSLEEGVGKTLDWYARSRP